MNNRGFIGGITLAIILVVCFICGLLCIEKIPVGYEGVVYSMNGGVQQETLTQGWHLVAPTKKVNEFTIAEEQLKLSDKDAFTVATSDNAGIKISLQMSYCFDGNKIVSIYEKFRGMDGDDIVQNRVSTVLKSKVSEVTGAYSMMDIYSGQRAQINKELTKYLNEEFSDTYGMKVSEVTIIDVHPDEQLQQTINDRVAALQKKQQAEAEQETIKVEAETKKIQAQAEADAMIIRARAEAENYRIKSEAITENLLRKWELDARLAHGWVTIQGGTPIVNAQ